MHQASCKEKDKAKGIVVFIHGFLGSPEQFNDWADAALASGYSVASLLLPGHGGDAKALLRVGESDWLKAAETEISAYCAKYKSVFLVGHSIGGLISLKIAAAGNLPIAGVCAIGAPARLNYVAPHSLRARIRLAFYRREHPIRRTYLAACSVSGFGVSAAPALLHSVLEIKKLMRSTLASMARVTSPVLLVYSQKDETVAFKSMPMIASRLANAPVTSLALSASLHVYYTPSEHAAITKALLGFIEEHLPLSHTATNAPA